MVNKYRVSSHYNIERQKIECKISLQCQIVNELIEKNVICAAIHCDFCSLRLRADHVLKFYDKQSYIISLDFLLLKARWPVVSFLLLFKDLEAKRTI